MKDLKNSKSQQAYWIGFFMCLFIIGVVFEIINQFEKQLTIEIMHKLYESFLEWSPIYMIGISIIGMIAIFIIYNKKDKKE